MYAGLEALQTHHSSYKSRAFDMPDPLDPDSCRDLPIVVTRRRLVRLALVAAETGARFQREGLDYDPVAWMLAPREMFDGVDGIEGALGLSGCLRAILLHGLGMGLDADPALIDELLADEEASSGPSPMMA
jgi:hypothetical protein